MERHIGTWHKENDSNKSEVGELLIDGNHLEFYSRFHGLVFPETFIGEDGQFRYKVFVNGYAKNLAYVSSAYKEAKVPTISTINTKYSIAVLSRI